MSLDRQSAQEESGVAAEPASLTTPETQWLEAEQWAWQEIRSRGLADFSKRDGRDLDPKVPDSWNDGRKLGSDFLKKILFREPHRSAIPVEGVGIVGAWFPEPVELTYGRLDHQLWLQRCRFDGGANLRGLRVEGRLSFVGSTFRAEKDTGWFALDLSDATIEGSVHMDSVVVAGTLTMNGIKVTQDMLLRMSSAAFTDVELIAAQIGGQLSMGGATFTGMLNMNSVKVGQHLLMSQARLEKGVELVHSAIEGGLDLSGARLNGLDLSATRIGGTLRLGSGNHPAANWQDGAHLTLSNAYAGAVRDYWNEQTDCWPNHLQLDGFSYDRLGGFEADAGDDMLARDIHWYIGKRPSMLLRCLGGSDERIRGWLERDPSYSPQPYEQLAAVFRAVGEPTKAQAVRYASRERARREAKRERLWRLPLPGWRWWGLTLLKSAIGYGIGLKYFRALAWVIGLTIVGTCVLFLSGQPPEGLPPDLPARVIYSLDQLLPFVELETYDRVVLNDGVAYYFYAQKLFGWVLASFLVAGLAGLTQR